MPGWQSNDPRPALEAFTRSCAALLKKPDSQSRLYAGLVADWRGSCTNLPAPASAAEARAFFESRFHVFAIEDNGKSEGLFTGYYEPELRASRRRHGAFQTPVYGPPADLISVDLGAFRSEWKGERLAGRIEANRLVPYAARAEIETRPPKSAPILFYAEDPVALFFLHIQGSGRVRFDDGSMARVSYAAQNGRPYTAIGRTLIDEGALTREAVSMPAIRDWLKANPARADEIMRVNQSYVFFTLSPLGDEKLGSRGSEGVPLTAEASLAIDNRIHPLGLPVFVSTEVDGESFNRLLIAQDTGGAIRGAIRGDIYWGTGARAEHLAGHLKSPGRLFVLLPEHLP